jgi:GNAT superfamily N-acetyltransferase
MLPPTLDPVLVATTAAGAPVGAAWWHFHDPPLLDPSVPEMGLAVLAAERGHGVGAALIDALAAKAAGSYDRIVLNVHVRNPAIRLYSRTGFEVVGKGRGPLGVAMVRELRS